MKYYSQHGEDYILHQIFRNWNRGFFAEIGCIDGLRFSNTYIFELLGWSGLCVEAHPYYIDLLGKNRPNSEIFHCAVGEEDMDGVTFYANSRGTLSTLDKSKEAEYKRDYAEYFTGFEETIVNKRTLNTIFDSIQPASIEILSLDIEGYEVNALHGLDFERYQPKVLVVESDSEEQAEDLDSILLQKSYVKAAMVSNNIFYIHQDFMQKTDLNFDSGPIQLVHTYHPLGTKEKVSENYRVPVKLFEKPNLLKRLRRRIGI